MHSERAPLFLKVAAWGGVIFLHFPLAIIAIYAFNTEDAAFSFPPKGLTLHWFSEQPPARPGGWTVQTRRGHGYCIAADPK